MSGIEPLFERIWQDFTSINPQAAKIHTAFERAGEKVFNDHVAYRSFRHPRLGIRVFSKFFEAHGYKKCGDYRFEKKKLYAEHFEHPNGNLPKVFISELLVDEFSKGLQESIESLVSQMPAQCESEETFCYMGRPWDLKYSLYEDLESESEYAAWMAAFGFRANHFTVDVNRLKNFQDLLSVNEFVKSLGYSLNESGGEIKGTPEEFLEQSSTIAARVPVGFVDGAKEIPSCYYEFAKRYPLEDGSLYQGFIAKSADKIFESTNRSIK